MLLLLLLGLLLLGLLLLLLLLMNLPLRRHLPPKLHPIRIERLQSKRIHLRKRIEPSHPRTRTRTRAKTRIGDLGSGDSEW
jgi:hypothetical protein